MSEKNPVGKTKDQGWEIGVQRTFSVSTEQAWETLMTQPGLHLWFGDDDELTLDKDATFETTDGTTGRIVSIKHGSLLRLHWQPGDWDEPSTLQIRTMPAGKKTTISFHQERLKSSKQRQEMQKHWSKVLDNLGELFI